MADWEEVAKVTDVAAGGRLSVVVDDTPEAIIISSYDPVRREIARMALSKLVTDGRIHPALTDSLVRGP